VWRACWLYLPLGLLVLGAGCQAGKPHSVPYAEVSGKVMYKGKPLPGGRITFVAVNGGFASSGTIHRDGTYKLDAPVGDVQIAVDNEMLRRPHAMIQSEEMMRRSPGEKDPVKGTYVNIPDKYSSPDQSGLTCKVEPGAQTHDVNLSE
jgi:hypothetical protein